VADLKALTDVLAGIAGEYPPQLVQEQRRDVDRIAFNIGLVCPQDGGPSISSMSICDIGGGIGLFSVGCAAIGFKRVVLIDDFGDRINGDGGESILALHRKYGVDVRARDVIAEGLGDAGAGADVVTCFDSMEHWHHSPRRLFASVSQGLAPGGTFVLSGPNCVNLRKRIAVPLGRGKWSSMSEWYDADVFRAHVREPDVDDLRRIGRDMGLVDMRIIGRNWLGRHSPSPAVRAMTTLMDHPLRLRPSLCSDLYLVGRKPVLAHDI
jgi:SAM-dependent methyltransferase